MSAEEHESESESDRELHREREMFFQMLTTTGLGQIEAKSPDAGPSRVASKEA